MTPIKAHDARRRMLELMREHRAILTVLLLLFIERVLAFGFLKLGYSLHSDDFDYIKSGIVFANTGTITMHDQVSAQIMPGMPWFIGAISFVFGEGRLLLLVLRMCWILMGTFTALYIYRSVTLFAPKWCGILSTLPLFAPDFVWLDNVILTETPYIFCSAAMIYHTLQMGRTKAWKHFWFTTLFYMLTVLLKANAAVYPLFAAIYLLTVKYGFKRLLRQGLILSCVVLLFVIPWSIRNYHQFHTFVPLTYGGGNPLLLGTAQGETARDANDNDPGYNEAVEAEFREKYADYLNEDGSMKEPEKSRFLSLEKDTIRAKLRMKEWINRDLNGFLHAYLVEKPAIMVYGIFYIKELYGVSVAQLRDFRVYSFLFTILSFVLAFVLKKDRAVMVFLALLYAGNLYIYAATFAFSRYGQTLVHIWYIMGGIGLYLLCLAVGKAAKATRSYARREAAAQAAACEHSADPGQESKS